MIINLLPWRESKRLYQLSVIKKMLLISFFFHLVFLFGWHILFVELKHKKKIRLIHLESKFKESLQWQVSLQKFNRENKDINENNALIQYRATIWQLFNLLESNRYETFCFTEIKRTKHHYIFSGKTRSIIDLMMYLNHWNAAYLFSSISISYLKQQANISQFQFIAEEKKAFVGTMLGSSFS